MTLTHFKSFALLPVRAPVRRTALAAGMVAAIFSGGLPGVGPDIGIIMGRSVHLPVFAGFVLHLGLAVVYGSLFSLVLFRSRDWWTILGALVTALVLYGANVALFEWPAHAFSEGEMEPLLAHLVFGAAFTVFFKLAEIGAENG